MVKLDMVSQKIQAPRKKSSCIPNSKKKMSIQIILTKNMKPIPGLRIFHVVVGIHCCCVLMEAFILLDLGNRANWAIVTVKTCYGQR